MTDKEFSDYCNNLAYIIKDIGNKPKDEQDKIRKDFNEMFCSIDFILDQELLEKRWKKMLTEGKITNNEYEAIQKKSLIEIENFFNTE